MIVAIPHSFVGSNRQAKPTEIDMAVHSFSTFLIVFNLLHPYSPPFLSFFPSLIHCTIPSWFDQFLSEFRNKFSIFSTCLNTFGANATCADYNWLLWYLAPTTTIPAALPFAQRARATANKVVLYVMGTVSGISNTLLSEPYMANP
jgi:hypothetical protein